MASDPAYRDAVLSRAGVHLNRAWDDFVEDPAIGWRYKTGNVPLGRVQLWIDALKLALADHEDMERRLTGGA